MKLIFENWRKFLKEEVDPPEDDEGGEFLGGDDGTEKTDLDFQSGGGGMRTDKGDYGTEPVRIEYKKEKKQFTKDTKDLFSKEREALKSSYESGEHGKRFINYLHNIYGEAVKEKIEREFKLKQQTAVKPIDELVNDKISSMYKNKFLKFFKRELDSLKIVPFHSPQDPRWSGEHGMRPNLTKAQRRAQKKYRKDRYMVAYDKGADATYRPTHHTVYVSDRPTARDAVTHEIAHGIEQRVKKEIERGLVEYRPLAITFSKAHKADLERIKQALHSHDNHELGAISEYWGYLTDPRELFAQVAGARREHKLRTGRTNFTSEDINFYCKNRSYNSSLFWLGHFDCSKKAEIQNIFNKNVISKATDYKKDKKTRV